MKFCSSPALEATCAGAAAPKFAVFAEAGPGPSVGLGQRPIRRKRAARWDVLFLLPRAWSVGPLARAPKMWQPDRGRGGRSSPTAGGKTRPMAKVWRRSGSQGAPPAPAPPRAPLQRRTDAPAAPAGIEVAKRGGSRRGRASAIRLFDRNGRSTSHGLEPRGTRVWQFDPVDGIVYCGARGRRVSLLGGQVELDPLEDGGFRA